MFEQQDSQPSLPTSERDKIMPEKEQKEANSTGNLSGSPGENPGENHVENPEENLEENPEENPGENSKENPEENPRENPNENPEENPEENPGENPEENPEENQKENPEDNPGENPNDNPENTSTENTQENSQENFDAESNQQQDDEEEEEEEDGASEAEQDGQLDKDADKHQEDEEFPPIRTPPQLRVYRRLPGFRFRMPALQKWKRIAHSIIIWLRLYHFHSSQVREILRFFSDSDLLMDALEESNYEELLFSVHSFKPNKQARVNLKTLNIMREDPNKRSQRDVRPIEAGLRGYEAFRKYPPNLLRRIAERAWFQEFDRHSVIVREGDYPLYYYFIIYGSALVSIIDRDKMIARTAAVLNRGDSFGELAIMNRVKRASTVIAREKCGLMMLEDKDYLEIFMQGGVKFLDDNFVRNHVLFRGFDLGVLKANPSLVKLNYFSPGVTIVEDSRLSFWIFLVISGKATVKMAVHKSVLQREEEEVVDRDERERQSLLEDYRRGDIGHRTLIRRNWRRHLLQRDQLSRRPEFQANLELRQLGLAAQGGLKRELSRVGREATRLPPLTKAYLMAPSDELDPKKEASDNQRPAEAEGQAAGKETADAVAGQKTSGGQKITYVTGREAVLGRRTLATDLNREFFEQLETKLLLGEFEEESLFEYLPVQVLERGMLFGFADHFFENQPALKLISKGCELLCIRRELYFDNADEITLFGVGNALRPYPSELAVLSKNKEVRAWTEVKAQQYDKTVTDMAKEAVDVHNALTRFPPIIAHKSPSQRYLK